MNSKYIVFALAFLLTLSSSSIVYATPPIGTALAPADVDTHGPRVGAVQFTVISSNAALESALSTGVIQAAEWTFSVGSFTAMANNSNVVENQTLGYTWDGIAFNTLHGYLNNAHFRRAIAYLQNYTTIQDTVLSGVAGEATPYVLPSDAYGFMSGNEPAAVYSYNLVSAASQLLLAGLFADTTAANANSSTSWCKVNSFPCAGGNQFAPKLQYRTDDPLRTGVALDTITAAALIGFTLTPNPVAGSGGLIYGPSAGAALQAGGYNAGTGYNDNPVVSFNGTYANSTQDAWDMYTFGWITSSNYQAQGQFWNSQFVAQTTNFVNYYNTTMDFYSNAILYAPTQAAAQTAAINVAAVEYSELPYLVSFWQNTLWADYVAGWTGYAAVDAAGPNTVGGLYYTLLNVHKTTAPNGGTLQLALHAAADQSGMNPLYNTNWVWQADVWASVYDTPLATPPTLFTTVNSFMNYMTTSYSISTFTGLTPSGSFNYQVTNGAPKNIVSGQKVTFVFMKNLTWSDNTLFTAKDYQYSLYYWDIAIRPTQLDEVTPLTGFLAGQAGLIASKTYVTGGQQAIDIYINSTSFWNIASVIVAAMPQHLLTYFNINHFSTVLTTVDTTLPYFSDSTYSIYGAPKAPTWVTYEANMEVGSGPFALYQFNPVTGAGNLTANPNYFRAAWWSNINATTNYLAIGNTYTHTFTIQEMIFNPSVSSSYCGVAPFSTGMCGITGLVPGQSAVQLGGTVQVRRCSGAPVGQFTPTTCVTLAHKYALVHVGSTSQYTVTIPSSALYGTNLAGWYEVILTTHFSFQGLARTWYQAVGYQVHS